MLGHGWANILDLRVSGDMKRKRTPIQPWSINPCIFSGHTMKCRLSHPEMAADGKRSLATIALFLMFCVLLLCSYCCVGFASKTRFSQQTGSTAVMSCARKPLLIWNPYDSLSQIHSFFFEAYDMTEQKSIQYGMPGIALRKLSCKKRKCDPYHSTERGASVVTCRANGRRAFSRDL